jgi:multiple sugar transport system ATP-binding protein
MGSIELSDVTKSFAAGAPAVDRVSLEIPDGEFLVLVGPSGCGKSTLLRMVAGIESVSHGRILIDGRDATHLLPRERDIAMVFQSYALYPHMTVLENLGFGLKLQKVPKPERQRRVEDVMRLLRLSELGDRKPGQLSGGQRQRVAMGRAMVREPAAFLMDEPLSNLDAKLRIAMRAELARLHERLGVTTIYVTHDQIEAMTLGQRVAVLKDGVLQQVDTPQTLYHRPANLFVAAFIGAPTINLVRARIERGVVHFADHRLRVPDATPVPHEQDVIVGIRPTDIEPAETADPNHPRIAVPIEVVEDLGAETHVIFPVDAPRVDVEGTAANDGQLLADDGRSLFTARIPSNPSLTVGDRVTLAINTTRLKYFDPATGESIVPERALSAAV